MLQVPLAVTWRDRPVQPTFGFRSIAGTWQLAQPPGSQPGREVPGDHCRSIAGFYKYAVEEELLEHSPAAHVRRPRVDYESHAVALDRNELGALLVAAGLGPPTEHALIALLALNGLRVSEASGADISHRLEH